MSDIDTLYENARLFDDPITDTDFYSNLTEFDWRNHIPYDVQEIWNALSAETRKALYIVAMAHVDYESRNFKDTRKC